MGTFIWIVSQKARPRRTSSLLYKLSIETSSTKVNMSAWWIVVLVAALQLANAQDTITTITIRCTGIAQGQPCQMIPQTVARVAQVAQVQQVAQVAQVQQQAAQVQQPCTSNTAEVASTGCGGATAPAPAPAPAPCQTQTTGCGGSTTTTTSSGGCGNPAPCETVPAPVNGNWGAWGAFCACSATCGGGTTGTTGTTGGAKVVVVKPAADQFPQRCLIWKANGLCNSGTYKDYMNRYCATSCAGSSSSAAIRERPGDKLFYNPAVYMKRIAIALRKHKNRN